MTINEPPIPPNADAPFSTEEGWHWARVTFDALFNFCPDPAELARQRVLTRRVWRAIATWLAPLEAFVRRLLLLEALALPIPNVAAPGAAARANVRASPGRGGFASEHSSDWQVSFQVVPPLHRTRSNTIRKRISPLSKLAPKFMSCFKLAERIEALGRVLERKSAYARRLARRLARRTKALSGREIAQRMMGAVGPARGDDPIGAGLHRDSYDACEREARRVLDSS